MDGQPKRGSIARRRAATAVACSALFALVGGVLLATPANAGILGGADACTTPTTLIDPTAAHSGAIDLSGSATGITLGVDCVTSITLGSRTTTQTTTPARPVSRATTTSASSTDATDTAETDSAAVADTTQGVASTTTTDATGGTSSSVSAAVAPTKTKLASLSVLRSSNTVYPVKDGYRDSVRFAVRAMNLAGTFVPVVGSAVLTKAGKDVETWHIDGSTQVITWDGRVGDTVRTGLYTLQVSAWSSDGSTLVEQTKVRVLSKHLEKRAMVVRSNVGAKSVAADLPHRLLKAYAAGEVTCRIVTVASVRGPAELVFSSPGVTRSVALKNGSHTTKALPVPQGFSHVTISHDWAKGDAHLKSLKVIWTYYTLT